jgi:hypothetical protein
MADQLQLRGGTTAQTASFTGALREVTVDTDKDTLVVHDGAFAGGYPLMRENGSNSALALGSAGIPSLKFTGDLNTGIYSPGADQIGIATGGTERARIDSSGRLLVGTSTGLYSLTSPVMALKGSFVSETFGTPSTGPTTLTAAIETGTGGQIHVTSQQGGVGSSYRVVPFVKDISGNLTLGAAITTTVRTADPIGTITAVSNNIDIVVTFANTRVAYWIQYVAIPF